MDDLVVRLRECAVATQAAGHPNRARLFREAADEVERLRGVVSAERASADRVADEWHRSDAENDRLRADLARWEGAFGRLKDRVAEVAAPPRLTAGEMARLDSGSDAPPEQVGGRWAERHGPAISPTPADLAALETEEG